MTFALVFEQLLNGIQLGVMLFLLAAGLTLVLGIMNMVNLAHGSLYMVGAYLTITAAQWTGSYLVGVFLGLVGTLVVGMLVEVVALRTLYDRDHLDQVLATFGLILSGATNRTMVAALGVNIRLLYTVVFGFGAALAGLAGLMAGPIYAVQPGMGEAILIQVFVVIVIGGIGSIRGALVGAILVGIVHTFGVFLKPMLSTVLSPTAADSAGPALASMLIYLLMAAVLAFRPQGLFPGRIA